MSDSDMMLFILQVSAYNNDDANSSSSSYMMMMTSSSSSANSFICNFCFRSFGFKSQLDRHIVTHTGEKPFKCPICFAKFSRMASVYRHARSEHHIELHEGQISKRSLKEEFHLEKTSGM